MWLHWDWRGEVWGRMEMDGGMGASKGEAVMPRGGVFALKPSQGAVS